jgi:hypothetical protein
MRGAMGSSGLIDERSMTIWLYVGQASRVLPNHAPFGSKNHPSPHKNPPALRARDCRGRGALVMGAAGGAWARAGVACSVLVRLYLFRSHIF